MTTWKHAERQIAKRLGGRRVPVAGRAGQPDVARPAFSVEVKHRRRLPQWLTKAMEQAERSATRGQLPLAVVHEAGTRYGQSLVLLRLADFEEWFGKIFQNETREVENDRE